MNQLDVFAFAAGLALALAGCQGTTADLGGVPKDAGVTALDASSNPLSGTYTGYIESFKFPDGSDVVTMTLAFADSGAVTGTVYFGTGAPLAPPTNPNLGYPPGYDTIGVSAFPPLEGFDFAVLDGTYASPRLTLTIQPSEIWKQWCEIQTTIYPIYNGQADGGCGSMLGYGCLPNAGTMGMTQGGVTTCQWISCDEPATTVDCAKMALCVNGGTCTCIATACTVPVDTSGGISFDMQLISGALNGSSVGLEESQVLSVHLMRQ
jgi:hypothetical protein